jgi:hypothetical protein
MRDAEFLLSAGIPLISGHSGEDQHMLVFFCFRMNTITEAGKDECND